MEKNWDIATFTDEHVDAGYSDEEIKQKWAEYQDRLKRSAIDTTIKGSATDRTSSPGAKTGYRAGSFVQKLVKSEIDKDREADKKLYNDLKAKGLVEGDFDNFVETKYGGTGPGKTGKTGSPFVVRKYRDTVMPMLEGGDWKTRVAAMGNPVFAAGQLLHAGREALGMNDEAEADRYRAIRAPKMDFSAQTVKDMAVGMAENWKQIPGAMVNALTDPRNLPENLATFGAGAALKGAGASLSVGAKAAQGARAARLAQAGKMLSGNTARILAEGGIGAGSGAFQGGEFSWNDAFMGGVAGTAMGEMPKLAKWGAKKVKDAVLPPKLKADVEANVLHASNFDPSDPLRYWGEREVADYSRPGRPFDETEALMVEKVAASDPVVKAKLDEAKAKIAAMNEAARANGGPELPESAAYQHFFRDNKMARDAAAATTETSSKQAAAADKEAAKQAEREAKFQAQVEEARLKYPTPDMAGENLGALVAGMGGPANARRLHKLMQQAKAKGMDVHVDERLGDVGSLQSFLDEQTRKAADAAKSLDATRKALNDPKLSKGARGVLEQKIKAIEEQQALAAKQQADFQAAADAENLNMEIHSMRFSPDMEQELLKMPADKLGRVLDAVRKGEMPEAEVSLGRAFEGYPEEYKGIQELMASTADAKVKDAGVRRILKAVSDRKAADADRIGRSQASANRDRAQAYAGLFDQLSDAEKAAALAGKADEATIRRANAMTERDRKTAYAGLFDQLSDAEKAAALAEKRDLGAANVDLTETEHAQQVSQNLNAQQELQAKLEQAGQRWVTNPATTAAEITDHFAEKIKENPQLAQEIGVDPDDLLLLEHGTKAQKAAAKKRVEMRTKEAADKAKATGEIPKGFM